MFVHLLVNTYKLYLVASCASNILINMHFPRFLSLRNVPAYEDAVKESFDRCLDLYLCPRARKKRVSEPDWRKINLSAG